MHLFTSNSKKLSVIFLITILLLVAYSLFLKYQNIEIVTAQNQSQANRVRLEKFLFRTENCSKVLLGSSLFFRLSEEDLGRDFCNIALAGGGALTGLEILMDHSAGVKIAIIEINILRNVDLNTVKSSRGIVFFLKKTFLFFQDRYQPVTLLVNFLKNTTNSRPPSPTEQQFNFWLQLQKENYSKVSEKYRSSVGSALSQLKEQIDILKEKNIRPVLIEIPMHPDILFSPQHLYLVEQINQRFKGVDFLRAVDSKEVYHTDDGIHLSYESAIKYSQYLKSYSF